MTFEPTKEQQKALAFFATGKSLVVEAGAGTGKTATLKMLAEATNRRGQYIAFNKAIVEEAKVKMPRNVRCNTAHSLAFKNVIPGTRYADRLKNSRRMRSLDIAAALRIGEPIHVQLAEGARKDLSRAFLAGLVMRSVTRFCQSADLEPSWKHVPYIDGIDVPPGATHNNRLVARAVESYVKRAWDDLSSENGILPYAHDHYLKQWHLSSPRIDADFILFDEAQDANPVLVAIVTAQTHAQLVWVGDSQQQIYTFTGAVNALAAVGAEQTAYLTKSFRFGPAIAEKANEMLCRLDAPLRLTGLDSIPSELGIVEEPSVYLSRTNAAAVRRVLEEIEAGRRPHLVGGGGDVARFARGASDLIDGRPTEHPDLACFATWAEVQEYVDQDQQGGDLRLLVNLIDEFGVDRILAALDDMPSEANADIVVSTAHKSKGREWDFVLLADDFPEDPNEEELRLLYVAVSRARLRLDTTAVKLVTGAPPSVAAEDVLDAPAQPEAAPSAGDAGSVWESAAVALANLDGQSSMHYLEVISHLRERAAVERAAATEALS